MRWYTATMRFRGNAALNPAEVIDQRGAGGGLGGFLPFPILLGGGGVLGLIGLVLVGALLAGGGGTSSSSPAASPSDLASQCTTGAAADQRSDCRVVAVVNSVQDYWTSALPAHGFRYVDAPTVLYTDYASTGCGEAQGSDGPFYCPADKRVYLDLAFFDDMKTVLGAEGGTFAQAYVIAHEYGHHVQDIMGLFQTYGDPKPGASNTSVRIELQADCYAGVWAHHATQTRIIADVTSADIADALNAASSVGDDRIEQDQGQTVQPDTFTHGTSAQRDRWFTRGYDGGDLSDCDTFAASSL